MDRTESSSPEESLPASERRFRALVERSSEALTLHAADGASLYHSPSANQLLGSTAPALFGPEFANVHPEDLPSLRGLFQRLLERPEAAEHRALLRLRHAGGNWRWIEASAQNMLAAPDVAALVVTWRDVSERKRAEEEREALALKRQDDERLEGLGVLAGGVAHNFNNLLTTILGFATLTQKDLPATSAVQPYLQQIEQASYRAAEICQQMLAYAGKAACRFAPLDLSALVRESTPMLRLALSRQAVLSFRLTEGLPPILADANQLRQVVLALVSNASEALGNAAGVITLVTERASLDEVARARLRHGHLPDGEHVALEVHDTGCGMDQATQAHIFEPFFSTKFTGRGLGLASVFGILRSHNGALQVESAPGRGSTFRLFFPRTSAAVEGRGTAAPASAPGRRELGQTLVMDGEEGVRRLTSRLLQSLGLTVLEASDGPAALKLLEQHAGAMRLLVFDLTEPGLGGEQAFAEARQRWPALPVLLLSGCADADLRARFAGQGLTEVLEKPFAPDDLLNRARNALGQC